MRHKIALTVFSVTAVALAPARMWAQTDYNQRYERPLGRANSVAVLETSYGGRVDFVTTHPQSCEVSVFSFLFDAFGEASRYRVCDPNLPGVGGATKALVADVNGDGRPDILTAILGPTGGPGAVSVLLGPGYQAYLSYPAGTAPTGLAAGDFNSDGFPDVVVPDGPAHGVVVLLNNAAGGFLSPLLVPIGAETWQVAVMPDGTIATTGPGFTAVIRGNGDGTFREPQVVATVGGHALLAVTGQRLATAVGSDLYVLDVGSGIVPAPFVRYELGPGVIRDIVELDSGQLIVARRTQGVSKVSVVPQTPGDAAQDLGDFPATGPTPDGDGPEALVPFWSEPPGAGGDCGTAWGCGDWALAVVTSSDTGNDGATRFPFSILDARYPVLISYLIGQTPDQPILSGTLVTFREYACNRGDAPALPSTSEIFDDAVFGERQCGFVWASGTRRIPALAPGECNEGGIAGTAPVVTRPTMCHMYSFADVNDEAGQRYGGPDHEMEGEYKIDVIPNVPPPIVTVLHPTAAGERLFAGSPFEIEWQTVCGGSEWDLRHDVLFSVDGGRSYTAIAGCTSLGGGTRKCVWTNPGPVTTQARVRVVATETWRGGRTAEDASDADFSILSGTPTVTVTVPNTEATWAIGSTQTLKWTHNLGVGSYATVEVSRDAGTTWTALSPPVRHASATSGSYTWLVSGPPTTAALFRVSATNFPLVRDTSDAESILWSPFLTVGAPNRPWLGFGYGTKQRIDWATNLGNLDKLTLRLSTDGGATFPYVLGTGLNAVPKTAVVTIPALTAPVSNARVRAEWQANNAVAAVSPVDFLVEPPFVRVRTPNGPQHPWRPGTAQTINWTSNLGTTEKVKIELSLNGGQTYPIVVVDGTQDDGSHTVSVQSAWVTTQARIRVSWVSKPTVADLSNASFPIR